MAYVTSTSLYKSFKLTRTVTRNKNNKNKRRRLRVNLWLNELSRVFATFNTLASHSSDPFANFWRIFCGTDGDQKLSVLGHLTVQLSNHLWVKSNKLTTFHPNHLGSSASGQIFPIVYSTIKCFSFFLFAWPLKSLINVITPHKWRYKRKCLLHHMTQ